MAKSRGRILIVDDEANARDALRDLLREEGYETETARDGIQALGRIATFEPEVVLTDLKMPRMDGLELLERGREALPEGAFVVMTAFGSIDTAVEAIKRGAENYLTKPLDLAALSALVERAMEKAKLSAEAARLRARLEKRYSFGEIIGDHPAHHSSHLPMQQVSLHAFEELEVAAGQCQPSRSAVAFEVAAHPCDGEHRFFEGWVRRERLLGAGSQDDELGSR